MGKIGLPSTSALRALAIVFWAAGTASAAAQPALNPDSRPYDERIFRLAEILGAVHYLRELCGANDGQLWREKMRELIEAEGSSALRRAQLARSFNNGYRSYSRAKSRLARPCRGREARGGVRSRPRGASLPPHARGSCFNTISPTRTPPKAISTIPAMRLICTRRALLRRWRMRPMRSETTNQ